MGCEALTVGVETALAEEVMESAVVEALGIPMAVAGTLLIAALVEEDPMVTKPAVGPVKEADMVT